ncbi:single-stranded DNA-binding protein [Microbacterium sp. Marseille-Q6965]|uniref:single-stranded DNA-binding protein n=1 Tax=Microbacterium sp. Marseille-Q6965 TaxID=2965072 RepID=UPI0021B7409C|nr:single-stranded DNA-binding protein [Microbacterium sp. Marseille-Q6965]
MSDIITIAGNIATEPSQITTPSGAVITRFRVASSSRRRDASTGEWIDGHTNWYTVCAYRHLGANAYASLRKGERIVVCGRLRLRRWENEDRHGMEAEIDADSLGHDLLFGTSAFARVSRPQSETVTAETTARAGAGSGHGRGADNAWAVAPEGDVGQEGPAATREGESVPF